MKWVSCKTKLPDNGNTVLITVRERCLDEEWRYDTDVATWNGERWETFNDWDEGQEVEIIAWMPLPKPYKENKA